MNIRTALTSVACFVIVVLLIQPAGAQLYSEDFDVDASSEWVLNLAMNGEPPTDGYANFFYDYSSVGIPSAPNTVGGTTRGMQIQANLVNGLFGGTSASPIGQSFEGNYRLAFDLWGNYVGDPVNGLATGGVGQTNLSTYGIMSDGVTSVYPGVADGIWFAATVDGFTASDYRVYSIERAVSYQLPHNTDINGDMIPDSMDGNGDPIDGHAIYHADSRNSSAALYSDNFGSATAPEAQLAMYSQQTGMTPLGSLGMEWHEMEIARVDNTVTWTVDGILLITLDLTNFVTPTDGTNIFFGHSDINDAISLEPDRFELQFTLIDNVVVEAIGPPANTADFNGNGVIDAADYTVWRDHLPITDGSASQSDGDANGDGDVDETDYDLWAAGFGTVIPGSASLGNSAVPEPATGCLALAGVAALGACRRRRK